MTKNYICNGEKYEAGGPRADVIGLPVELTDLPATIDVEGLTLQLRPAFHVSLVCVGRIMEQQGISDPNFLKDVLNDFCEFVQTNDINIVRYRNEYRFVSCDEKRTVVVMCDVSNLDKFFDLLNQKHGLSLEYPPTHITLYTLGGGPGQFLTDSKDIAQLTKTVNISLPLSTS